MPPKKEERKPLEPLFKEVSPFYEYLKYSSEQLDQLNEFLTYFKPELTSFLKNNVFDNMEVLCQWVGVPIHPSFIKPVHTIDIDDFDENTKFRNPEDNEGDLVPTLIQINSIKVDLITLKLFEYCASISGVTTLKLTNNNLDTESYQQLAAILSNPENKIKKLFIDWQQVNDCLLQTIQGIEFLTLRSCQLNQKLVNTLCRSVQNLKCLDLYDNKLSKQSLDLIGEMLKSNASMEFLGLARNAITSFDDLHGIVSNVGRFLMSQEEYDEYKVKEKERDSIIERNKKAKIKEPVPVLEPIQQIDNNWYIVRNSRLWLINLSMNQIDDQSREAIEKFLLQTGENFQLVLTGNRFDDQKALQKTKKRFGKKLVL